MRIAAFVLSAAVAAAVPAQARIIKELGKSGVGSEPHSMARYSGAIGNQPRFTQMGKWTYFNTFRKGEGDVFYRTDGTTIGTRRVTDLHPQWHYPGRDHGAINPMPIGDKLLFVTADGSHTGAFALYFTNTATNVTKALVTAGVSKNALLFNNEVWFAVNGKPWKSNGTAAGTGPRLAIAVTGFNPRFVLNGALYFLATSAAGSGLHKTDGTAKGTTFLNMRLEVHEPVQSGGLVYFRHWHRLYVTDGTVAGTRPLSGVISPFHLAPAQGGVFFSAKHLTDGVELHFSDGKTVKHFDLNPGSADSNPTLLTPMGKGLAFVAAGVDPKSKKYVGIEPWLFDGTSFVVHDLFPNEDSKPAGLLPVGNRVLVGALNGLYSIDRSGARWIHGVEHASNLTPTPNGVIFAGTRLGDREPWFTDGTTAGTRLIRNIETATTVLPDAFIDNLVSGGDRVYFTAWSTRRNQWVTDGTTAGTQHIGDWPLRVKDPILVWNDLLFAEGEWASAITGMVFDLRTNKSQVLRFQGSDLRAPSGFQVYRDAVWILANTGNQRGLFRVDRVGVQRVAVVGPSQSPGDGSLVLYKDRLYFQGVDTTGGRLWRSDGTATGTGAATGFTQPDPRSLTVVGKTLFFVAMDNGRQDLFTTDGTAQGTAVIGLRTIGNILPARFGSNATLAFRGRGLAHTQSRVFFYANSSLNEPNNAPSGSAIWVSDGTRSGTFSLQPSTTYPWIATNTTHGFFATTHPTNRFKTGFYSSWGGSRTGMYFVHTMQLHGPMTRVGERVFTIHPDPNLKNRAGTLSSVGDPTLRIYWLGKFTGAMIGKMVPLRGEMIFAGASSTNGWELFALPIGAYSTTVVPGCSRTTPPTLHKSKPVIGKPVTVNVRHIPTNKTGFYAIGISSPTWTHLGGHCQTVLDLTKPLLLVPIRPNAAGAWSLTYTLPADSSMIGIIHPGQAVVGPTNTAPFGMDFSNGIHVHIDTR